MAAVSDEPIAVGLQTTHADSEFSTTMDMPELRELCMKLGLDPEPINELQKPDMGYLQEMAKLSADMATMPAVTDVQGMRRWVKDAFASETWTKEKARFQISRRRPAIKIEKTIVPVPCLDGTGEHFDLWIYTPQTESTDAKNKSRPVLLMFHGGGWIHGSPIGDELFAQTFASELDAVIVGVDYRLAPEHPFPTPLEDCALALKWVCDNAKQYNIDTHRVGLWGASAGGNLAAALALRSSQAVEATERYNIRLVSLVVPVTAHPKAEASFDEHRSIEKSSNEELFANVPSFPAAVSTEIANVYSLYIGDKSDPCDPMVSPLASQPTPGHPPALVTVAACDFLRPQGLKYSQLLRIAGVRVTEDILAGVPHGFTFALNSNIVTSWLERQIAAFAAAFDDSETR